MNHGRGSNLVPILPAGEGVSFAVQATSASQFTPPKRSAVLVACQGCRRKRIKCGGQRPSCNQCVTRGEGCEYVAEAGETVTLALRRRVTELESENNQYKELFQLLRDKPEEEAYEILRRIRAAPSPRDAWGLIKQAELLLPTTPAVSPETSEAPEQRRSDGRRGED
ncbi:hypothetical protein GMORB2_3715 [Geosmithia morbida]|uniref:Zn(2)-C6 fungal-type domain-containing protein n=1 Tax=Geosmithia morbida TaxID=1094350 RepID=A0A9P5D5S9_9HYPO|nr:uncharacterized protein GMORB2_3715 [Geosmithia morbida]KAF4124876.1 hypothetical protein GMORB2_3715 [Geosmithia morbida]